MANGFANPSVKGGVFSVDTQGVGKGIVLYGCRVLFMSRQESRETVDYSAGYCRRRGWSAPKLAFQGALCACSVAVRGLQSNLPRQAADF